MDIDVYKKIEKEYALKREEKIRKANLKKEMIYNKNPKIRKLEDEKNILAITVSKKLLIMNDLDRQIAEENLTIKLNELDQKIKKEVKLAKINMDDFNPEYDCKICNDTGIVKKGNKTEYCPCFIQSVINETYKQSNLEKIYEENFETFDLGFFSDMIEEEKYKAKISPRKNIEKIRQISLEFANNILNKDQKNLLFTGNTGLGKTFLSNCIAKKVLENGNSVIYQTSPIFMDKIMKLSFSFADKDKVMYDNIFDVDLLIIDDLGTETLTNNKYTELFKIINTRLTKNKKILISTNLTLNELYKRYDERVMSRLIGEFNICKFIGDDIRLKKKRLSHDKMNKN